MTQTHRKITKSDLIASLAKSGGETSDFDLNAGVDRPDPKVMRDAGVLLPVRETDNGLALILTKRASHLKHHPGQISFPGGRRDEGDSTIKATALREAWEEIKLPKESVEIIGSLPVHYTVSNFVMHPIVGFIRENFEAQAEPGEVSEIFEVPLDRVVSGKQFRVQSRRWKGVSRYYFTVPYGPYYIWGATARILRSLADRFDNDED